MLQSPAMKAILFGLILLCASNSFAQPGGTILEILRRVDLQNQHLKTLSGNITVSIKDGKNATPTVHAGTIRLVRTPERLTALRIDWSRGHESLFIAGERYRLRQPDKRRVIAGTLRREILWPTLFDNFSRKH